MHQAYRGQFTKLLQYIDAQFLPALSTSNDADARAVYTRWVGGGGWVGRWVGGWPACPGWRGKLAAAAMGRAPQCAWVSGVLSPQHSRPIKLRPCPCMCLPLVCCRIQTYLRSGQYAKPPEGREMPQFDSSSYDRA